MTDTRRVFHYISGQASLKKLAARLVDELDLFVTSDRVFLFDADANEQLQPINVHLLRELIDRNYYDIQLIQRDGRWQKDPRQLSLTRQDLIDTMGEILKLAPPGPFSVRQLTPMQIDHAYQRLRQGESAPSIARSYNVPVDAVLALRNAA